MACTHVVRQGDCLSSIAAHYGFQDWQTIYNHPSNADFRAKRTNPNVIYPGDELYIPDREVRTEACVTDQKHCFVATIPSTYLNVCVQDVTRQPLGNVPYKVLFDALELTGTTDGEGWVRQKIPASASSGSLLVWPNPADPDGTVTWRVSLGHLDPLETTSGIKARLNNLGYECGEDNDVEDEAYAAAVRRFQEEHGLEADGIPGSEVQAKLKDEHRL
jgi:N-acetylmuramoyl-L-alanine amidase